MRSGLQLRSPAMTSLTKVVLYAVLFSLCLFSRAAAQSSITYYVSPDPGPDGDGLTPATPFTSMATAFAPIVTNFGAANLVTPANNYTVVLLPGTHTINTMITMTINPLASNLTIGFMGGVRIMSDPSMNSTIVCSAAFPFGAISPSPNVAIRTSNVATFILANVNIRACDRFFVHTNGLYSAVVNTTFDAYQNILPAYLSDRSANEFTMNFVQIRTVIINGSSFNRGVVPFYNSSNTASLGLIGAIIHQNSRNGEFFANNCNFFNYSRYAIACSNVTNCNMDTLYLFGNNRIPPAPGAADTPAIFFRLLNNFSLRNLYAAVNNYPIKVFSVTGTGYMNNVTLYDSLSYNMRVELSIGTFLFENVNFITDSTTTPAGITMSKLQILQTPNVYLRNFYVSGTKHQGAGPVYVGLSTNVTFENMTLLQSDTLKCMSFVGSEVSIINSTIDRQNMTVGGIFWETLLGTNPGGQTSGSNVTLNHCIVRNMVNSQIYVDHLSSIVFNRTAFIGNGNNTIFMPNPSLMDIGGSFVALDSDFGGNLQQVLQTRLVGFTQPSVSLTGCRLLDLSRMEVAPLINIPVGTITVSNSNFTGRDISGSALSVRDSGSATVTNSIFTGISEKVKVDARDSFSPMCGVVYATGLTARLTVQSSNFYNNTLVSGAGICGTNGATVSVSGSSFIKNFARYGGGLYCADCALTVDSTEFTSNGAVSYGGALYLNGMFTANIKNTVSFGSNFAANGGAIYGFPNATTQLSIESGTVFDSNYAKVSGGALFSASQVIPFSSTGLVLRNNSALIVGGDFAMPPFKFVWYNTNSSQAMSPSSVRYGSLNSGSVLPEIVVRVYDSQNSLTAQGATELLLITVLIADVNADPVTATSSVRAGILGELQKAAIQGGISFKNLRVVGVPGTYQLIVRSISDLYPASQFYLAAPLELSDCSMDMVNTTVDYSSFPVCDVCRVPCGSGICYNETHCMCPGSVIFAGGCPGYSTEWNASTGIGITATASVIVAILFATLLVVVIFREAPVIRASSPVFVALMIIGFIVGASFLYTNIGQPTTASCMSQLWTVGFFIMIVFGSLAAKTFRVYRIFSNNKLRLESIQTSELLTWVGALIFVQAVILIIWTAVSPFSPDPRTQTCSFSGNMIFSNVMIGITISFYGVVLIFTAYMAWCTRKVHSAFRESTLIFFAVYNFLVSALAGLVVLFVLGGSTNGFSVWIFKVIAVLYLVLSTFLILIGPKLFVLFFTKGKGKIEGPVSRGFAGFLMVGQPGQRPFTTSDLGSMSEPEDGLSSGDELTPSSSGKVKEMHSAKAHAIVQSGFMHMWRKRFVVVDTRMGVMLVYADGKRTEVVDTLVLSQCALRESAAQTDQFELVTGKGRSSFRFQFKDDRKCGGMLELIRPITSKAAGPGGPSATSLDHLANPGSMRHPGKRPSETIALKGKDYDDGHHVGTPRGLASRSMEVMKSNEMTMM